MARPRKRLSDYGVNVSVRELAQTTGIPDPTLRWRFRHWPDRPLEELLAPPMSKIESGRRGGLAKSARHVRSEPDLSGAERT